MLPFICLLIWLLRCWPTARWRARRTGWWGSRRCTGTRWSSSSTFTATDGLSRCRSTRRRSGRRRGTGGSCTASTSSCGWGTRPTRRQGPRTSFTSPTTRSKSQVSQKEIRPGHWCVESRFIINISKLLCYLIVSHFHYRLVRLGYLAFTQATRVQIPAMESFFSVFFFFHASFVLTAWSNSSVSVSLNSSTFFVFVLTTWSNFRRSHFISSSLSA